MYPLTVTIPLSGQAVPSSDPTPTQGSVQLLATVIEDGQTEPAVLDSTGLKPLSGSSFVASFSSVPNGDYNAKFTRHDAAGVQVGAAVVQFVRQDKKFVLAVGGPMVAS